jgi:hypothetical protein
MADAGNRRADQAFLGDLISLIDSVLIAAI